MKQYHTIVVAGTYGWLPYDDQLYGSKTEAKRARTNYMETETEELLVVKVNVHQPERKKDVIK